METIEVAYLCKKEKCKSCNQSPCELTFNPDDARNPEMVELIREYLRLRKEVEKHFETQRSYNRIIFAEREEDK